MSPPHLLRRSGGTASSLPPSCPATQDKEKFDKEQAALAAAAASAVVDYPRETYPDTALLPALRWKVAMSRDCRVTGFVLEAPLALSLGEDGKCLAEDFFGPGEPTGSSRDRTSSRRPGCRCRCW